MAVDVLNLAKSYLSDDVVGQISDMLGETPHDTRKALDGALPVVLGGLIQKVNEPGGASAIMDLIGEVTAPNREAGEVITPVGGILGQLGSWLTDKTHTSSLLSMGAGILQSLFGDRVSGVSNALASYSGVKPSSASSLLSLAGPILLSVLGRQLADDGTGIAGLSTLLSGQSTNLTAAIPSGLRSLLGVIPGLGLLSGLGSAGSGLTSPMSDPAPRAVPASNVPPVRSAPTPVYTEDHDHSSGGGANWLPWLLLLLGAAALFYFLRSCGTEKQPVKNTTETVMDSTAADMNAAADTLGAAMNSTGAAIGDATDRLGAFFKRKLPSGLELNIPELGIENNLIKFIEDAGRPVDKTTWFNFDRLLFDTGKATLRPESQEQLDNVAAILKEYPNVNIKLGGYTDNTGSAAVNRKLSQDRADTVLGELVKLGIDKSRLEAEGYGPEYPVASNDTEAGRAENRRIAIRVTKK